MKVSRFSRSSASRTLAPGLGIRAPRPAAGPSGPAWPPARSRAAARMAASMPPCIPAKVARRRRPSGPRQPAGQAQHVETRSPAPPGRHKPRAPRPPPHGRFAPPIPTRSHRRSRRRSRPTISSSASIARFCPPPPRSRPAAASAARVITGAFMRIPTCARAKAGAAAPPLNQRPMRSHLGQRTGFLQMAGRRNRLS